MKIKILLVLTILSFMACKPNRDSTDTGNGNNESLNWASSPIRSGLVNQCFGPFNVRFSGGTGSEPVSLDTRSPDLNYYSDFRCTSVISSVQVSPSEGILTFYVKDDLVEQTSISISYGAATINSSLNLISASTLGDSISFLSIPGGRVGDCSGPIQIGFKNASGSVVNAPADIDISLNTTGAVNFYRASDCSIGANDVILSQGSSSVAVYFLNSDIAPFTLTASSAIGNISTGVGMSAGSALGIHVANNSGVQGQCIPVTMNFVDYQGNPTTYNAPVSFAITLTGTTASSYPQGDSDCTGGTGTSSFTVPAGQGSYTFYVQDDTVESMDVQLDGNGWQSSTSVNVKCGGFNGFFSGC
jgi:hypothetical protein